MIASFIWNLMAVDREENRRNVMTQDKYKSVFGYAFRIVFAQSDRNYKAGKPSRVLL